jgi:hypothetical protein
MMEGRSKDKEELFEGLTSKERGQAAKTRRRSKSKGKEKQCERRNEGKKRDERKYGALA